MLPKIGFHFVFMIAIPRLFSIPSGYRGFRRVKVPSESAHAALRTATGRARFATVLRVKRWVLLCEVEAANETATNGCIGMCRGRCTDVSFDAGLALHAHHQGVPHATFSRS